MGEAFAGPVDILRHGEGKLIYECEIKMFQLQSQAISPRFPGVGRNSLQGN